MVKNPKNISLPPGYNESRLLLLMQSPRILYVYWELSQGLKQALSGKKIQLRLNAGGQDPFCTTQTDLLQKSYYFTDVEPGLSYYCEIGVLNAENEFFPLLRSNFVNVSAEKPSEGQGPVEFSTGYSSFFKLLIDKTSC